MKKIIAFGTLFFMAGVSMYSMTMEVQPALFWIDLFAPNVGDTYSVEIVFVLTMLTLLLPVIVVMAIIFSLQNRSSNKIPVSPYETGIWINRKKQLQSAIIPISIFINNEKVGSVNMGQTLFFSTTSNRISVHAGTGGEQSSPFPYEMKKGEQLRLELEVLKEGFGSRYSIKEV